MKRYSSLDLAAIFLAAVTVVFLAFVIRAPFFHAALIGAGLLVLRAKMTGRRELYIIAAYLPPLPLLCALASAAIIRLTPHPIDATLLATDFGMSRAVYLWFDVHPLAFAIVHAVYYWLPIWGAIVLCFTEDAKRAATVMVVAPLAALPFALAFPACGPVWAHTATAPRNCIPSMHMGWVLLLCYYSPRRLRPIAVVVAFLTACATLGLGEHYVIDLVAAVPFSLAVVYGVEKLGRLSRPLALTARCLKERMCSIPPALG